ncbi:uncharacterized protein LOC132248273 [Alligator mississippiensis]|uniref:uncharacterized protein LOC132248273 n=1 Tax=Alligator mississippiensis TaxID=8496 RepID=UPI002877678B|nr:uncharacterized protein LOC132248273 [Alligator mississippiensis]
MSFRVPQTSKTASLAIALMFHRLIGMAHQGLVAGGPGAVGHKLGSAPGCKTVYQGGEDRGEAQVGQAVVIVAAECGKCSDKRKLTVLIVAAGAWVPPYPGLKEVTGSGSSSYRSTFYSVELPPLEEKQASENAQPQPDTSKGRMRARMFWDPAKEEILRCQEPWDKNRTISDLGHYQRLCQSTQVALRAGKRLEKKLKREERLLPLLEPNPAVLGQMQKVRRQLFRLDRQQRQKNIILQQTELIINKKEQCEKKCHRDEGQLRVRGSSQKITSSKPEPSVSLKKS